MSGQRHATVVAAATLALTMTPMLGLFEGLGWTIPILLTITVIAVTGGLLRAAGRGQGIQTLGMLAALLMVLTAGFGNGSTPLFIIPMPGTFAEFGLAASEGVTDIISMAPPVAADGGILFLTMAGVGIVAILHDMFIVGLRTPALSGLTLLTMYLVPVSVAPEATSWFWFILPAVSYLWVLGDDNLRRVSRFGHRFTGQGQLVGPRFPSPMAATARMTAVAFVSFTLLVLAVVPTNTSGLLDQVAEGVGGESAGPGSLNPWVQLSGSLDQPEPVEVARLTTDDESPRYLRMHVLDELSNDGFTPTEYEDLAPLDTLSSDIGDTYTATLTNSKLPDKAAPFLGRPFAIDGLGEEWGVVPETGVVASEDSSLSHVDSYSFSYTDPEPEATALADADTLNADDPDYDRNTAHPDVPELTSRVESIMAEADAATAHEKVRAVLDFLSTSNGFTYSLETADAGTGEDVLDFLETKQGYCQQYAATMAWMLREADVPARVAIGLAQGTKSGDEWVLMSSDYHAWVEVYFEGFGWLPFDPTPAGGVAGSVSFPWEAAPPSGTTDEPTDDTSSAPEDEATTTAPGEDPTASDGPDPTDQATDQAIGGTPDGGGLPFNPAWLALVLLAAVPFLPMLWRGAVRRSRLAPGRLSAPTAWAETRDLARDYGVSLADSLTPRQAAARLASAAPGAAPAAQALGSAMEAHRYSPRGAGLAGLPDAVADLRTELDRRAEPRRRWLARLWPASLVTWFAAGRDRGADRLARLKPAVPRQRRSNTGPGHDVTGRP